MCAKVDKFDLLFDRPTQEIGGLMLALRKERGLSQTDVDRETGWAKGFLSKCEHGKTGIYLIRELETFADAIGVPRHVVAVLAYISVFRLRSRKTLEPELQKVLRLLQKDVPDLDLSNII